MNEKRSENNCPYKLEPRDSKEKGKNNNEQTKKERNHKRYN